VHERMQCPWRRGRQSLGSRAGQGSLQCCRQGKPVAVLAASVQKPLPMLSAADVHSLPRMRAGGAQRGAAVRERGDRAPGGPRVA
jgi:hypothetical protein